MITQYSDVNWVKTLSALQSYFNNALNVTIDRSSNEIVYDFKIRDVLAALIKQAASIDREFERFRHQKKAVDVTSYVMIKAKIVYDSRHTSFMLKLDEKVFLRLHKRYSLSFKLNVKLFNQRIDSFIIKRRVERLTYELNLSSVWRVHSMISVTQLKSASSKSNLYLRSKLSHSDALKIEDMLNTDVEKNYEIERLINKRNRIYDKIIVTQYLVRWLDYESEYDEWKFLSALAECTDLIEKYELAHSAMTTENKISNVVDAFRLDDLVKLNKSILSKTSAISKSARLKKTFASSSDKRSRDRSLKRL